MALNVGQLLGGAGIVGRSMTERENQLMRQRDLQLQLQANEIAADEAARLRAIRAQMGQGAETVANAPIPQFNFTPGTAVGSPPPEGTVVQPAPAAPAPAPAAPAPAPSPASPAAAAPAARPPAAAPAPAAAVPTGGLRTPQQLAAVQTNELSVAEFQALPPAERLRRLQAINRERQAAIDRANLGRAPAAAADVVAGGPYNAIAQGGTWLANQIGIPRLGRALGIYDADVTRVEIPTVGTGSATPYYDMIRQVEQANRPLTEAQLLEQLKTGETTRARTAEAERVKNAQASQQQGYADWQLDAKGKPVRGLINNNPGNIRPDKAYTWQGSTGEAGGFVQFSSPEAGIRAMTINLLSYNARGLNTVQSIISTWAPEKDNNKTGAYINDVSKALGVKPTDRIDVSNPQIMQQLVTAIIQKENGKQPYDPRVITNGIALGYNKDTPVTAVASASMPAPAPGTNAPAAPPAVAVNNAVQTGTVNQVADAASKAAPPPTPSKDGYMYGSATVDASVANPQIQQILQTRSALQRQVALFNQYGFGDKAWEAASKIQAIDLGLYKNQADLGVYEGATTGNFSRAMSVLSAFTGSPHQVLRRPDGKFDLYVNGKATKAGLDGTQVELLVKTQVDSEYRKQLATLQSERSMEEFKSRLRMAEETNKQVSTQTLQTAREIQLEIIKGNTKLAEKKLEMAGFKAVATGAGDGKVTYSNGLGDFFVVDTVNNQVEVNGVKLDVGPRAQRVSGVDRSIWSTVNAPQVEVR